MQLLCYPTMQFHATVTAFPGPVKVSVPFPMDEQSTCGMLICTEFDNPDDKVPLDGMIPTFFILLVADQFKLSVFEVLVSETEHSQLPPVWSSKHCRLAKIVVGVTDKVGACITVSVTCIVNVPDPILKVTFPVYVPAASCAFKLEALMVTLLDVPVLNVPVVGFANNQFPPLLV